MTQPYSIKTIKEGDLEGFHKSSYVKIGNEEMANAYFAATSKTFFNEKGSGDREPVVQTSDKQNASNFSIGGSNNHIVKSTAMKDQFALSPMAKKLQPSTEFVKHLKANHFELAHDHGVGTAGGSDPRVHYKTLHQNYFKQPPSDNPDAVSPSLAKERKLELNKAHFDLGSPTIRQQNPPLVTAQKTFFNHPSAQLAPKAPSMHNNATTLKYKNVNVHHGGPAAHPGVHYYASNTAQSFKWVQPQFVH